MCSPRSLVQVEISEPHPRRPKCVVPCVAQSVQLPGSAPWVGCCRLGTTVAGTLELVLGLQQGPRTRGSLSCVVLFGTDAMSA